MTPSPDPQHAQPACAQTPDAAATLAAAFETFNAVSRDLENSYRALEREAGELRRELRHANRRHAEQARRNGELAQRLATLIEALPGGVLLVDGDGVITQANAVAGSLLGEPLIGAAWTELRQRAFAAAQGSSQGDLELRDGRRVNLAQKNLQPGPGQAVLLTDITDRRRIEELLARHRRLAATGEMAAALAHQIRTPLAAALLYATNASRHELPGEQRDGLLAKAVTCLHDLERLVGDMLQFARGASLSGTRFTLNELLDGVETSLRPIVLGGQRLTIDGPAQDVTLAGNRETLASALINLATNALNAAGAGAEVQIVARAAGLQAEIIVVDNGPGIPAELRERIFDPFFTSRANGTGLGLAVARSIARAHRGDVTLVDATAGGTTFALRLPLAAGQATLDSQHRDAAA
jgi:two-component system sensor histidine kinase FlrB